MTGASPWSVKGISAEERDLAKQAARRAGVPIGQWLSRQIREAAEAERTGRGATSGDGRFGHPPGAWRSAGPDPSAASGGAPGVAPGSTAAAWRSALAGPPLAAELPHPPPAHYAPAHQAPAHQALQQHPAMQPVVARPQPPSVDPARIRELERRIQDLRELEGRLVALEKLERRVGTVAAELATLGSRLEEAETRVEARTSTLSREVRALDEQVEELRSRPSGSGDAVGSISASTAPIERAVMRLAERLQRVEELTLPDERPGRGLFSRMFRR